MAAEPDLVSRAIEGSGHNSEPIVRQPLDGEIGTEPTILR